MSHINTDKLISKANRMYQIDEIPYEWEQVVELIKTDPEIFAICLHRANENAKRFVTDFPLISKSQILWIACNLVDGFIKRDDCYLCGKTLKREEFLAGDIHLEHLNPRDKGGLHTPGNITLVCKNCNLLKSAYNEKDFDLILNDPEAFRAAHPYMQLKRYQQLVEFTEIISHHLKGHDWFIDRYKINPQNWRQVLDHMRFEYRKKWKIQ